MRIGSIRQLAWIGAALLLASCAQPPAMLAALPPPPVHADGQVLWGIVNGRCVPGKIAHADPAPCAEVRIAEGVGRGHVVLKDREGASQYLVMPTRLVTGIEDPFLLSAQAPDYFTPAWAVRRLVEAKLDTALARDDVSVAVNSLYGRTQDLLHLHIDCQSIAFRDALRRAVPTIGYHWSRQPLVVMGYRYRAVRIDGDDRVDADPFKLLSKGLHVPPAEMGAWTLVLAGANFPDGRPGFVLLASRADPAAGYKASGGDTQDHDCAGRGPKGSAAK